MNPSSSLFRKGVATFALQGGGQAGMFLAHLLLGQACGVTGYGLFAYLAALANLLIIPAKLGQDSIVLRQIPIYIVNGQFGLLRGLLAWTGRVVLKGSLVITIVAIAIAQLEQSRPNGGEWFITIGLAAVPLLALGQIRAYALMGLGKPVAGLFPEYILRPMLLICSAIFLLLRGVIPTGTEIAILFFGIAALSYFAGLVMLNNGVRQFFGEVATESEKKSWLRSGVWMLLASGAYQAFSQIDVVVVGTVLSKRDAGIYSAASRISVLIQYGLVALQVVAAPRIAAAYSKEDKQGVQQILRRVAVLATSFAAVATVPMMVIPGHILGLFGYEFTEGSLALRILLLGHLVNAATGATGFLLTMTGHERRAAVIIFVALLADFPVLVWGVSNFGIKGAAITTASAMALTHSALAFFAWRRLGVQSWFSLRSLLGRQ